jgi:sensor histidine kinase YesM
MFGSKYGLSVSSLVGKGTSVKFILPAMPKEEMDKIVQIIDSR